MAPSPLDKQAGSCNSPHGWLMSLAMDLADCVICGGENGTNGCHLAVFSVDVASSLPLYGFPPFHLIEVLVVLATPAKIYLNGGQFS